MGAGPVILRELGEQARRPALTLLRVLSPVLLLVGALHLIFHPVYQGGWVVVGGRAFRAEENWSVAAEAALEAFNHRGSSLFAALNFVLLAAIWILGPLITADCLSRERREGTLGLLLLTPLTPRDVVTAKWTAHTLRATSALVATIPILLVPILLGGVSGNQILRAVLLDAASLALALSAGLYASIRWQGPRAVQVGALLVAATAAFTWLIGWSVFEALLNLQTHSLLAAPGWIASRALERFGKGLEIITGVVADPRQFLWLAGSSPIASSPDLLIPAVLFALALGITRLTLRAVTRAVALTRILDGGGAPASPLAERFTRPSLLPAVLRTLRRACHRISPVLDLETLSWRLRLAPWLALLAVGIAEPFWILNPRHSLPLPVVVLCSMVALSAAASLHRERTNGVLELLLTTPRGLRHLVLGKLVALLVLALPAAGLILAAELASPGLPGLDTPERLRHLAWILASHVPLTAAVGLYWSLRLPAVPLALLATVATTSVLLTLSHVGPPMILGVSPPGWPLLLRGLLELAAAGGFVFLLARSLRTGRFSAR
ncbi:MAG: ABC transporter permease subunit [Verrucomicrobiales bacterium]|nr:ABC transporter permease subunit [Verrucomicrobiales bacterium]